MFVVLQDRSGRSYGVRCSPKVQLVLAGLLLGCGTGFGSATGNILASALLGNIPLMEGLGMTVLYAVLSLVCSLLGVNAAILGARYWGIGLRATYGS